MCECEGGGDRAIRFREQGSKENEEWIICHQSVRQRADVNDESMLINAYMMYPYYVASMHNV